MAINSYILMYHSLDQSGSVISTSPETFRLQMEMLKASGSPVTPLCEVKRTPGAVAITFDDGFGNFAEFGAPVLRAHRFPATVFVVSGYAGTWNSWPPQPQPGIPKQPLMSWSEVRNIAANGIEIGSHTMNHPKMPSLPVEVAAAELRDSRARLSDELGRSVDSVAYPYGESGAGVRTLARKYYRLGCGTGLSFVDADSDEFDLPRIDAYYLRRPAVFKSLLSGSRKYIKLRSALRSVRAAIAG